jgi:hypothetical protein
MWYKSVTDSEQLGHILLVRVVDILKDFCLCHFIIWAVVRRINILHFSPNFHNCLLSLRFGKDKVWDVFI